MINKLRKRLDLEDAAWFIRCIKSGELWVNKHAAEWFGHKRRILDWHHAIQFSHHKDVKIVEDAMSRMLKTGETVEFVTRVRTQPHQITLVRSVGSTVMCGQCGQCAAILYRSEPVASP